MRARVGAALLTVVLLAVASACSSGDDGDDGATATTAPEASSGGAPDGDVDCEVLVDAAQKVGFAIQILAQLHTQAQYDSVKSGVLDLQPEQTLADIETLRALEDVEIDAASGSVEASLDLYQEAAELAAENLAVDDAFADAQGDELSALVADLGAFLGNQVAVSAALDEAGCT